MESPSRLMKVFFISETFRADAIMWLRGIKEYSNCEIVTWEIKIKKGPFSRILRIWDWLMACIFLRYKIKKSGAAILLAERVTSYGFLGAISGFHPFVVAQQGITDVRPANSFSTPFKAFIAKYALKKADLIQAWGEVMVPAMLELGADPDKIKVLAKGIDLELFSYEPGDKKWDKIRAVVTRSLTALYCHEDIIKAARILKDKNIQAEIRIIGDGPEYQRLQLLAKKLMVEDIILFEGRVAYDKIHEYLIAANMYISVPNTDGVSGSLFEAMGSGAFPVATDLAGTRPWITNEKNGYLVPVNNPEALADAIIKAWNNQELMKKAVSYNRKIVEEKADFRKNLPVFIKWYEELINKSQSNK